VVAVGAAIQGGVLGGEVREVVLLDVTPLSLGVETLGGVMTKLIERNTTIPTRKSETFTTAADGQTDVEIHVLQGEREMARDNRTLGRFHLTGIPPAPRGVPQIEVTFDIDANGIVNVSAKDMGTGREQSITISGSSQLNKPDVERMVREGEAHADEDRRLREEAETRNRADSLVYATEKTLRDLGDKVPSDLRQELEGKINTLKQAVSANDMTQIRNASDDLQQASYRLSEILYRQTAEATADAGAPGAPEPGGEQPPQGGDDEGVIDAEYKKSE